MESLAKLEIQQQIREHKLDLVTSYILEAENASNPFASKRNDIQAFIDKYTAIYVSAKADAAVRQIAKEIMKTGVRLMDACHIACALVAECDVFLSSDKRLLHYQTDIMRIMNPTAFIIDQEV